MATLKKSFWLKLGPTAKFAVYPEAASQSFKINNPVVLSSGKVAAASVSSNKLSSGQAIGIALSNATGTTDSPVVVFKPGDADMLVLPVDHGTPSSAVTAVTQVGASFDCGFSSDIMTVRIDGTTATYWMVEAIDPTYPVGEQYGLLNVSLLAARRMTL